MKASAVADNIGRFIGLGLNRDMYANAKKCKLTQPKTWGRAALAALQCIPVIAGITSAIQHGLKGRVKVPTQNPIGNVGPETLGIQAHPKNPIGDKLVSVNDVITKKNQLEKGEVFLFYYENNTEQVYLQSKEDHKLGLGEAIFHKSDQKGEFQMEIWITKIVTEETITVTEENVGQKLLDNLSAKYDKIVYFDETGAKKTFAEREETPSTSI